MIEGQGELNRRSLFFKFVFSVLAIGVNAGFDKAENGLR